MSNYSREKVDANLGMLSGPIIKVFKKGVMY